MNMNELFHRISVKVANVMGTPLAFLIAIGIIILWAIMGPGAGYSDTWQLIINTGTTIGTFLMVFLIQNTQNRDARAIHIKLDELVHAVRGARNSIVDVEELSEEELEKLHAEFHQLHESYASALEKRRQAKKGGK